MKVVSNVSHIIDRFGFEKTAELYADAGFGGMEITLQEMWDKPESPLYGDDYLKESERMRKIAERIGIPFCQTHMPGLLPAQKWLDRDYAENFLFPQLKRSLEVTAELGAKFAVSHPLNFLPYRGNEERLFEINMRYYEELIPLCEKLDVYVCIENIFQVDPRTRYIIPDNCSTIPEFLRYVDTLNHKNIVACLDTGHVGLPVGDDECWDFVRALGHDRLRALHVHDNDYRRDGHMLPYLGKIDWAKFAQALGEIDYQGDLTYELSGIVTKNMDDRFVPTALRYMVDVGHHICDMVDRNRPQK